MENVSEGQINSYGHLNDCTIIIFGHGNSSKPMAIPIVTPNGIIYNKIPIPGNQFMF